MIPNYVFMGTSHGFLGLATVLYTYNYPKCVVFGQVVQYGLSVLIWSPFATKHFLWMDRITACVNIVLLGSAHCDRGVLVKDIGPALITTLLFKMTDWYVGGSSPWYFWWHVNLIANNTGIALRKRTLSSWVYPLEYGLAVYWFYTL